MIHDRKSINSRPMVTRVKEGSIVKLLRKRYIVATSGRVSEIKLLTYNAFIAPRFEKYTERKHQLIDNLRNVDSDVICLQEIFYGEDVIDIKEQLKAFYPYSYSAMHRTDDIKPGPACLASELPVLTCIQSNGCLNAVTETEQLLCGVTKCSAFQKLSQDCLTCLAVSGSNASTFQNNCLMSAVNFNTEGLILLSKKPMFKEEKIEFHPGIVQVRSTAYIQAQIKDIGQVRCTHLTGYSLPLFIAPNMPYKNFHEQTEAEVKLLLKDTCEQNKIIIMGDLNVGPRIPLNDVSGIFEDLYMEFIHRDFTSPYVDLIGRCTYCGTNNRLALFWPTDNLVDHIMIKGYQAKNAKRLFDSLPLTSDHYGVEISI